MLDILRKASAQRRPVKRASLLAQLRSLIGGGADERDAEAMLERLVSNGTIELDGHQRSVTWRL